MNDRTLTESTITEISEELMRRKSIDFLLVAREKDPQTGETTTTQSGFSDLVIATGLAYMFLQTLECD